MDAVLKTIHDIGIVPVVKLDSPGNAVPLGKAMAAGGIPVAEVTFRTAAALDSISALAAGAPEVTVGAGTVMTAAQARDAVGAGARFIVCPAWIDEVVDFCLAEKVPVLPGTSGPDGVARAANLGLEAVKFFPAESLGGVATLDALAGPFGSMRFVPTGGVGPDNIGEYARRKQVLAVGGSWMVKSSLVEAGDWKSVERLCEEAVGLLHGFHFAHVGVNGGDEAKAHSELFASLFRIAAREGSASFFASDSVEIMKGAGRGTKGHIGLKCNDVERALAYLKKRGISGLQGTERREKGRLTFSYLDLEIGGFAIHLGQA